MSNTDNKNPSEASEPNYKRFVSGSGDTILPENAQSEKETIGPEDAERSSEFRLPEEFNLVRRLGRGGMGEVYLVERDSGFNREQLALKTILPEQMGNEGAIERFKREVATLLRLKHENIVQLRDFRLYRGYYYFLMEYIEGVTLQERVAKRGVFSASEALNVFVPLAQALDYAHGKGVIHRDLKPSNIMLGSNGTVYLLDFGIARHQESEHTTTRRMGPGTWEYMSPEQFDDDEASASMDVYGLGATIYYALTGNHPFDATSIRKLLSQKDKGCPDVSRLLLPDEVTEGLEMSLHPEPGSRPKSCGELIALMRGVGKKKEQAPTPPPKPTPPTTPTATERVVPVAREPVVPAEVKPAVKPAPPSGSKSLVLPSEFTNSLGMEFRLIEPGTFMMGSPENEAGRYEDETQHRVTLTKPYYLGVYEVTQDEYERLMGINPSNFKGRRNPVESISYDNAIAFIKRLNDLPEEKAAGRVYRLPTEAEWEYACRAGSSTAYCFGDDETRLGEYAWYYKNSGETTHPVGEKRPNGWGLYDMHGNVWEWCNDWYGDYPSGSVTDPTGASSGSVRVCRGGGWDYEAARCRSATRFGDDPSGRCSSLGFRLVLSS